MMRNERRCRSLGFKCSTCQHDNAHPQVDETEGGTPIALCDGCGQQVSAQLIASIYDDRDRARRAAINEYLGWGVDVV